MFPCEMNTHTGKKEAMVGGRGKGGEKKWRGKERQKEGESKGRKGGTTWMNLGNVMLSQRKQTKSTCYMTPLIEND